MLQDEMTIAEALRYVTAQYDAPDWVTNAIVRVAENWDARKYWPNIGANHPTDWPEDQFCGCNECLSRAVS